ncbi:MAG: YraN family protein [Ignavibacteriae bacterium]|nr:MAG: YraN family protein [Ignavibacteriota bacterium]
MTQNKNQLGNKGEDIAVDYLKENNYKIIERNYRFGHGEIDIIAEQNEILIFIEVKTRKNLEFGPPELAVTKSKQRQIKKIAEAYLYENEINDKDCRMDVIAILKEDKLPPRITHIENAF